jgi:hypothetical protein
LPSDLGVPGNPVVSELGLYESVMWPFHWSAVEGLGLPDGLDTMPIPFSWREGTTSWLVMGVGWASRGQPARLRTTLESARCGDPRARTALYQPVEVSGTGADRLASQALAQHQHAIAIRTEIVHYMNFNVNAEPGRLRKRLLPVW